MKKVMTICFLVKENSGSKMVCLAEKKRGFRSGKINGYGGKLEEGETIEECAIRETHEESGITPLKVTKKAEIYFSDPELTHECHVYVITEWQGNPVETEEMNPAWYSVDTIPFDRMGQADQIWIPQVLEGENIVADFYYDENNFMYKSDIRSVAESYFR